MSANAEATPTRALKIRSGERPAERVPVILETSGSDQYRLIDSGAGEKLEQYGPYRIVRPEAQALWQRSLPNGIWDKAEALFTGDTDEDGMGRWKFPKAALGETWPMQLLGVDFHGRFTAFRHVGVFPEQLAHWSWMKEKVEAAMAELDRKIEPGQDQYHDALMELHQVKTQEAAQKAQEEAIAKRARVEADREEGRRLAAEIEANLGKWREKKPQQQRERDQGYGPGM